MLQPVLVIGSTGQVARALARIGRIGGHPVHCLGRAEVDATDHGHLSAAVADAHPVAIINAAAYTAVDKAESEPEAAEALNAGLPGQLAGLCAERSIPLVHISTDYVFDGGARQPYRVQDPIAPLGVYGATKAEGEHRVRASLERHVILRTAWVYGEDGHNFARTMLRLGRDRDELRVVADQRGTPTYAGDFAATIARLTEQVLSAPRADVWGTFHLTGGGETTLHGFAAAIFDEAATAGLKTPRLVAITTADYPTPARRPAYSVLDNRAVGEAFGLAMPHWRDSLRDAFPRIKHAVIA